MRGQTGELGRGGLDLAPRCLGFVCTVLVLPALRKDTQRLPWKLYLVVLILQFSPPERSGREREQHLHFHCQSNSLEECHISETFSIQLSHSLSFFLHALFEHPCMPADIFPVSLRLLMDQVTLSPTIKQLNSENTETKQVLNGSKLGVGHFTLMNAVLTAQTPRLD